jgi:hypothetical protein
MSIDSVKADDTNYSASIVIELVDEFGAPVTNAYVVNLCTNESFHSLCDPQGLVDSNGTIRFDRLKSSWFFAARVSDPLVVTNIPLLSNYQTNRILLKQSPKTSQATGSEVAPQPGR